MSDLIERAASELAASQYAIVLTGAGMSTESGIRDFRGPQGIWTSDRQAEAKAYERYDLFLNDPVAYWREMQGEKGTHGAQYKEMRKAEPNKGHLALAELEKLGYIKHLITQNIDGLHRKAGNENVIEYHGSIHRVRCPSCGSRFWFEDISLDTLPPCCNCGGVLKYDVVHFKEPIPFDVMKTAEKEAQACDLMLICGTSAVVYPFAGLPRLAKMRPDSKVAIIEINAEPTELTSEGISNYIIQGKTGEILPELVNAVRIC